MRYIHITDASKVVMIREPTPQDYKYFNQPLYTAVPSINGTLASSAVVGTHTITTSAAAAAVHSTNSSVDHHHHSSSSGSSSSSSSSSNSSSSRRQEVIAPSSMAPPPVIVMSQHKVDVPVSTAFTVGLIDEGKVVKPMPIALRRKMIADQQHQQQLGEVLMMLMIVMELVIIMLTSYHNAILHITHRNATKRARGINVKERF